MKRLSALGAALVLLLTTSAQTFATTPVRGDGTFSFAGYDDGCIVLAMTGAFDGEMVNCLRNQNLGMVGRFSGWIVLGDDEYGPGSAVCNLPVDGRWTCYQGRDGLVGFHANGSADDLAGTYQGRFHFDPPRGD